IGSNLGRIFNLDNRTLMLLVGCGATAAVSGIFKAPIAGLVFNQSSEGIDITLNEEFSSELGIGVLKLIFEKDIKYKRATLYPQINEGRFI
ncbi:MAG: chloride channel protein, partial [Granulicatella adiacens]